MRLSFEIVLSSSNLDSRGRKLSKSRNKRTESSNSDNNEGSNKRSRTSSSSGDKGFVIANGKLNNKTNSSIREEQALTVSSTTISTTPKVENNISIPTTSANHFHNAWFEDLETLFSSTVDFGNLSNHNNPHPQNGSLIANIFNLGSHYDEFVDPSPEEKNQWETKKRELSNVTTPASPNTLTDIETDNNNTNTGNTPRSITSVPLMNNDSLLILSHEEENILLKHFFKKLLPLLDGHPSSPWPDLALKYCDFNVARSCFISLASMHMYECREGGEKFYETGVRHINSTMNHLIQYINETISKMKLDDGSHDLSKEDLAKTYSSSFVILVLINVNVLFLVLEKGKSAMARYFFEVFGTICQDPGFYDYVLTNNDKKRSLCVALSWYDTVAAVVSPDCRLPCTMPEWYGNVSDSISTAKIMGCPGEVFIAMSEVCLLRHEKHNGANLSTPSYMKRYEDIKSQLIRYRDYVPFESDEGEEPYVNRMKCASCWALAVLITLNKVVAPPDFQEFNNKIASEFIMTYGSMESKSPLVTQMVWPVYAIACECKTEDERTALLIYMETLYETAQMGTLYSLKEIVLNVWERGMTQEDYLREWLEDGIDYLPV